MLWGFRFGSQKDWRSIIGATFLSFRRRMSLKRRSSDSTGRRISLCLGPRQPSRRSRISAAIDGVIKAEPADSIIVTHGTVLTLYVASATGVRPICFWRRLGLPSFVVLTLPDRHIHSIFEDVVENGTHG